MSRPDDPPDARGGYLAGRFLYPRDASVYGADERAPSIVRRREP